MSLNKYPRTPHATTGGIVYFARLIDKVRLHAAGELHPDLVANLGIFFDKRCCDFLRVEYPALVAAVTNNTLDDEAALAWCFANGRKPSDEEIEIWNAFMSKRGWRDAGTPTLVKRKAENGFEARDDIRTMFDYIDADEGRPVKNYA